MAAARRRRDASTVVMTGYFVLLTFSKIRMGNRLSCSSLATRAVISKRGSTSLLTIKTSSGDSCRTFSMKLRRSAKLDFASDTIFLLDKFAVLAAAMILSSLDDFRTLFVQELVTAIGTEQLDLLAPKFLVVTIELAVALRAGHPENFRHGSSENKKSEIRSTKFETKRSQIVGKFNRPIPVCFIFLVI